MVAAVADEYQMIRVRVKGPTKERWDKMLEDRKMSQQDAVVSLIEFILGEEPLTQNMIFQQTDVNDRAELSRIVLRRLAGQSRKKAARRG